MAVFRVNKNNNYTCMSNVHLRDKGLTLKAKGLLSVMLSLPDDWDYSINGLVAICKENGGAIRSALGELEKGGYLRRTMGHDPATGKFDYIYDIYETADKNSPYIENPHTVNPYTVKPQTVKPYTENHAQLSTDLQSTELPNTDNKVNARKRFTPPTVDDVRAYCKERGNRVNAERFVDFYGSKGWVVGKSPMKDWKAAVRNWERDDNTVKENPHKILTEREVKESDFGDNFFADIMNIKRA